MRLFRLAALIVLLIPVGSLSAQPVDEMRELMLSGDYEALENLYESFAQREDFDEIEADLLNLAKEQVVTSNYEAAYKVLEIILAVNLLNLEAQDVYVAVNSLLDGRVPGSDAPSVAGRDLRGPGGAAGEDETATPAEPGEPEVASLPRASDPPVPEPESTTTEAPDEDEPETVAAAPQEALPADGRPPEGAEETSEPTVAEQETAGDFEVGAEEPAEAAETAQDQPDELPTVREVGAPEVTRVARRRIPLTYEAFAGPVSLLGNTSGFYRDFHGSGRFNVTYGLSLDLNMYLRFPRFIVGPEVSFDTHFWNLNSGPGDQIAYKVSANLGFPELIQLPLFARIGFAQQWYVFGSATPDVLITSFPTPTLGVMLRDLRLGSLGERDLDMNVSLDLYLISFFTSYFSIGLDSALSLDLELPVSEKLSINPRIGLQPQILLSMGNVEFAAKLEIGVGVVSHE